MCSTLSSIVFPMHRVTLAFYRKMPLLAKRSILLCKIFPCSGEGRPNGPQKINMYIFKAPGVFLDKYFTCNYYLSKHLTIFSISDNNDLACIEKNEDEVK